MFLNMKNSFSLFELILTLAISTTIIIYSTLLVKDLVILNKTSLSKELAAATGSFAQQAAQLSENAGVLSGYNDQITTAQSTLDSTVAQREAAWEALSQKYIDRSANMRDILGGLTVEAAK